MPIPPNAVALPRPLDPSDVEGYGLRISKGLAPTDTLRPDESVQSFTLVLTPEAVLAGLIIREEPDRAPKLVGELLTFWLSVDPAMHGNSMFDGAGKVLAMELTFETNSSPSRRKQKTITAQVANQ